MLQCASAIAPFDSNTECQSHTACCVGIWCFERHTVWLKARLILLWKEEKPHFYTSTERNTACLEDCFIYSILMYFVGICFLERSNALPWRKIAAYKWTVYFEMKMFVKATLYLIDECLIMFMGASRVAFAAVSKWFGLLGYSNLSILFPPHRLFVMFTFFCWWHLLWINILAETSGMIMCMKN